MPARSVCLVALPPSEERIRHHGLHKDTAHGSAPATLKQKPPFRGTIRYSTVHFGNRINKGNHKSSSAVPIIPGVGPG